LLLFFLLRFLRSPNFLLILFLLCPSSPPSAKTLQPIFTLRLPPLLQPPMDHGGGCSCCVAAVGVVEAVPGGKGRDH